MRPPRAWARRPLRLGLVLSAVALLSSGAVPSDMPHPGVVAPPLTDAPTTQAIRGCRNEVAEVGQVTLPISNCSDSPTARIVEVVRRTDAAYEGLLRTGDRLMANNQWVAWIDTQDAPGILRGLWSVDAEAAFLGISEPEIAPDAAKSLVSITAGYSSTNAPFGYKGLHVEIWKTMERGSAVADECFPWSCLYTVPNGVRYQEDRTTVRTTRSLAAATYHTPLVNLLPQAPTCPTCGTTTFVGLNGVSTQLLWNVTYLMTRTSFRIVSALSALADVEFSGAAGGLMLLFNPGCRATARNAYEGDPHFKSCEAAQISDRALHRVQGPSIGDGRAVRSSDRITVDGDTADSFAPEHQVLDPTEDRWINQYNDPSPFRFRYADGRVALTVTPGWDVTNPNGQGWLTGFSTHFNATPLYLGYDSARGLSGVSGIGSVDAYIVPGVSSTCQSGCSLAVGPTRGQLIWSMALTR